MKSQACLAAGVLCVLLLPSCQKAGTAKSSLSRAFLKIEGLRSASPVDFVAIGNAYALSLQGHVARNHPDIDSRIVKAAKNGLVGTKPHVQAQIIGKSLQLFFFREFVKGLELQIPAFEQLADHYRALAPTVERRSKWVGSKSELQDRMRLSLDKLRAGDRSEENRKVLRRTLEMTYVLSVFYELEGIRDHRGKDKEKCEEKAVEAQIFFEIVSGGAASEQSRKAILENLNRPCAEIDLAVTWAHLLTAFPDAKTYLGTKAL